MSKIQSHESCIHPSSKSERAKCRRQRSKFGDVLAAVFAETAGTATIETPVPVFEPVRVTRENWKDFRSTPVRIATQIDDETQSETATGVSLIGWGARWIDYRNDEGKTKRTAVSCVRVTTVEA